MFASVTPHHKSKHRYRSGHPPTCKMKCLKILLGTLKSPRKDFSSSTGKARHDCKTSATQTAIPAASPQLQAHSRQGCKKFAASQNRSVVSSSACPHILTVSL